MTNALHKAIIDHRMDPEEFELTNGPDRSVIVSHARSNSVFQASWSSFGARRTRYAVSYRAYDGSRNENLTIGKWGGVIKYFKNWVRTTAELEQTPNLWADPWVQQDPESGISELNEPTPASETVRPEPVEPAAPLSRKEWVILVGGAVLSVVIADTFPPALAHHFAAVMVYGLEHVLISVGNWIVSGW